MSDDANCYAATPAATLEQRITDSNVAKSEAEWWAYHEITRLREELAARARIAELEASDDFDRGYRAGLQNGGKERGLLRARIAELGAALKPFADKANIFHDYVDDYPVMFGAEPPLRVGDFRAARDALNGENG